MDRASTAQVALLRGATTVMLSPSGSARTSLEEPAQARCRTPAAGAAAPAGACASASSVMTRGPGFRWRRALNKRTRSAVSRHGHLCDGGGAADEKAARNAYWPWAALASRRAPRYLRRCGVPRPPHTSATALPTRGRVTCWWSRRAVRPRRSAQPSLDKRAAPPQRAALRPVPARAFFGRRSPSDRSLCRCDVCRRALGSGARAPTPRPPPARCWRRHAPAGVAAATTRRRRGDPPRWRSTRPAPAACPGCASLAAAIGLSERQLARVRRGRATRPPVPAHRARAPRPARGAGHAAPRLAAIAEREATSPRRTSARLRELSATPVRAGQRRWSRGARLVHRRRCTC